MMWWSRRFWLLLTALLLVKDAEGYRVWNENPLGQPGNATDMGDLPSSVASMESSSPFLQQGLESSENEAAKSRWASSSGKGFSEDLTEIGTAGYYQSVLQSGQKLPETVTQTQLQGPSSHEHTGGNVALNTPLSSRLFPQGRLYHGSSDGVDTDSSAQGFRSPYTSDRQQIARGAQQSSSRHLYGTTPFQLSKKGQTSSLQSAVWSQESQLWGSGVTSTSPQPGQHEACKSRSRYGHLDSQEGQAGHPAPTSPRARQAHPGKPPTSPLAEQANPGKAPTRPRCQAGHPGSPLPSPRPGRQPPAAPYQPSGQAGQPRQPPTSPRGQAGNPGSPYQPSDQNTLSLVASWCLDRLATPQGLSKLWDRLPVPKCGLLV
ncbi:DNA-directed RNA polymerase II subunit RPB1-like [Electrophorus electricus]|uniref:DNA-directed RNA polymerase II subunit RPB1-like n=1 Tax=Electrophorus electricus TaxID=8005 RepID=UPI0015CFB406|nr:DNA-directed RNA polymerase II subunit RPB1-like [Electrophorus electricus]